MAQSKIRILLLDDQTLFREGLAAILNREPDLEVVGQSGDGSQAMSLTTSLFPDIVILSFSLPGLEGAGVASRLRALTPSPELIFLSSTHNEFQMRTAFEAGARAYLLKSSSSEDLLTAIHRAVVGEYFLTAPASYDMLAEYVKPLLKSQRPGGVITPRERDIARLLADGYSTKEAAAVLNISPKTAETHRASLMRKLNARNVTDIVKYCIRNRIIEI